MRKYVVEGRNEKWVVRTKAADPEFAVPRLQPIPQKTKQYFKEEHLKEFLRFKVVLEPKLFPSLTLSTKVFLNFVD